MKMELNEQQYQRVARFLDGEPLELTPQERTVALDIRADMETLGVLKQIQPSSVAMAMARKRMAGELARPGRRGLRIACFAAAAAAAAILLVVTALPVGVTDQGGALPELARLSPSEIIAIYESDNDYAGMSSIDSELAELEADVYTPILAVAVGAGVDSFEHGGDIYWTDDLAD